MHSQNSDITPAQLFISPSGRALPRTLCHAVSTTPLRIRHTCCNLSTSNCSIYLYMREPSGGWRRRCQEASPTPWSPSHEDLPWCDIVEMVKVKVSVVAASPCWIPIEHIRLMYTQLINVHPISRTQLPQQMIKLRMLAH